MASTASGSGSSNGNGNGAMRRPAAPGSGGTNGGNPVMRAPKRRKTPRACDYCRGHKLRCDFSQDLTLPDGKSVCKHCADFGIECIFTAPSSTRRASVVKLEGGTPSVPDPAGSTIWQVDERAIDDPRYSGESSLSAIIQQFMTAIKSGRDQNKASRQHPPPAISVQPTGHNNFLLLPQARYPAPAEAGEKDLIHAQLDRSTTHLLVDRYLTYIQPLNAIVSRKDVLSSIDMNAASVPIISLSPIALSLLCVSAVYRETPRFTRAALLFHLRQRRTAIFRSSVETVQSLLLLSQNIELMAPDTNDAGGMSLNLTGLAVRMAQDLGMHRDVSLLGVSAVRARKSARIWSSCVLVDRWYALCYGQPCLINLDDCDAPLPSFYDDDDDEHGEYVYGRDAPHETHVAHYHVAVLIGRIHRIAFGPRGFHMKSYGELKDCIYELDDWAASLPPHLHFSMRTSEPPSVQAGFLFAMKVSLDFILYRVSLNVPADVPPLFHAKDKWQGIVRDSADALEWLASQEGLVCLDSYSIVMYFLVQCTVVHFYEASRGGSLHSLRVARQSLQNRGTVATQVASRGQIYDPYGPQNGTPPEGPSSGGGSADQQKGSGSGGGAKPHVPSPSPESAGAGPPKLLRLRVKISALVSMLVDEAERRRAIVLKRKESGVGNGLRPLSSAGAPPAGSADAASSARLAPLQLRPAPESQRPLSLESYSTQSRPGSSHQQHSSSSSLFSTNSLHSQKRSAAIAANGGHSSPSALRSPKPAPPPPPSNGQQSSYYPTSSDRMRVSYASSPSSAHAAKPPTNGIQLPPQYSQPYPAPTGYGTPPTKHDAELGAGTTSYATPTNGGSVHDSASLASTTSPKALEDLDLMTLQRWADALLFNPNQFGDASTLPPHVPPTSSLPVHLLPHPSVPTYGGSGSGYVPHYHVHPPPPSSSSFQPPAFQPLQPPHTLPHHAPHARPQAPHLPAQYGGNRLFSQ